MRNINLKIKHSKQNPTKFVYALIPCGQNWDYLKTKPVLGAGLLYKEERL